MCNALHVSTVLTKHKTGAAWRTFQILLVSAVLYVSHAAAKSHRNSASDTPGQFDYYLLTLSWAPEFCATHGGNTSSSECDPTHHFGFVVHGLWPENEDGSYPQHCAPAQPVSQDTVRQMLPIMPDRGLIQHEWATHGTCSALDAQTYFGDIKKVFGQIQIPAESSQPIAGNQCQPIAD